MKNQHSQVRNRQAGVTLVEVMVGLTIGLLVLIIGAIVGSPRAIIVGFVLILIATLLFLVGC